MRRIRDRVIDPANDPGEWRRMLLEANVPDRFWEARVELVKDAKIRGWLATAVARAHEWLGVGAGFFMSGPNNTGKSSIAAILAMEAIRRGEVVVWLPIRDVPRVRFRSDEEGARLNRRLAKADLLILDDIGQEAFRLSGAAGAALEDVLRIVYDRKRSICMTCNLNFDDFCAAYAHEAPGLVSAARRLVWPVYAIEKWPDVPSGRRPDGI